MRSLALVLLLGAVVAGEQLPGDRAMTQRVETILAAFHTAKGRPAPNDWLARHEEPGQTVADFIAARPKPGRSGLTTIWIQPLGAEDPAQARLLDASQAALEAFFVSPVRRLPPLALDQMPASARRAGSFGEQLLSTWLLDELAKRRPGDAIAVLGLTGNDLWPGAGWNFVFGQASLSERVGVWSTARFGKADDPLLLERTVKTAVHETGHQLGIRHCLRWECLMNGSNHLAETDAGPLWLCHECEAKITWYCGGDPIRRLRGLSAFAVRHGFARAADLWSREADALDDHRP